MKRQSLLRVAVVSVPALGLLSGCAMFSDQKAGVYHVDDLVGRVERVQLEAELSKTRVRGALEQLHTICDDDFVGDPLVAFEVFMDAVEASEVQVEAFVDAAEPMQTSANGVFAQWEENLLTFSIPELRNRSRTRLETTRKLYSDVHDTVEHARTAYETFNLGLRDHATFLEHDFNPSAVRELQREVRALTEWGQEVERRLDAVLDACEAYVASSALPGEVGGPAPPEAGDSEPR